MDSIVLSWKEPEDKTEVIEHIKIMAKWINDNAENILNDSEHIQNLRISMTLAPRSHSSIHIERDRVLSIKEEYRP